MFINATKSPLIVGRFRILPGDKVPALPLSDKETKAVSDFVRKGFLVEKESEAKAQPEVKTEVRAKKAKAAEVEAKPEVKSEVKSEAKAETQAAQTENK